MPGVNQKTQVLLRNLCAIFGIPRHLIQANPEAGARLLLATYAMPLQRTQAQRRSYANNILAATQGHFDAWSPFVVTLGRILITMQELPFHFNNVGRSTAALVQRYENLSRIIWWIKASGLAAGASSVGAANAGVAEAVKTGSVGAAAKKAGARVAGYGAVSEAVAQRFGARLPKGAGGGLALVVIGGVTISYYSAEREMQEIRSLVQHRFQGGQATDAEYRTIFAGQVDPVSIKKYWRFAREHG